MVNVQGFAWSHWMPSLGNYSLLIAPAAARVPFKTTRMKEYTNFAGHYDGHCNAPVLYLVHCLMEEVQGFTRSHWMPPLGKYPTWYYQSIIDMLFFVGVFHCQLVENGLVVTSRSLLTISSRGMAYQTEGKDLANMTELFVGVVKTACYCLN
jgi:hypothetical protein